MKKIIRVAAMVLVSAVLLTVGVWTFGHQSSAAFETGLVLCALGLLHWVWWPEGSGKAQ
jgi:hypothetical protein